MLNGDTVNKITPINIYIKIILDGNEKNVLFTCSAVAFAL